jgi:FkbM family methyltransferase
MKWKFLYRGVKARYRDQRNELSALTGALQSGDVAVDVGSNKGSYLWALSRAVPNGQVVAFEPQPVLTDYLRRACRAAGLNNVVVEGAGVSTQSGQLTLAIPGKGESSPGASFERAVRDREACRTITVPTYSLDDYFASEHRRIGAIKIDVEGHELAVLEGATKVLSKHLPVVVCECEARHMTTGIVSSVFEFFYRHGYEGVFGCGSQLISTHEFKPAVHQREVGERFWDQPGYCNNFIWTPRLR